MILQEPVPLRFGPEEEAKRNKYVYDNITSIKDGSYELINTKIKKWRKLKDGRPEKDKKDFPWRGASNLVIQVIGMNIDNLLAQIMASIYEVPPLWPLELVGDWDSDAHGEEQRKVLEQFMQLMGLEQDELDLYRVESTLFDGAIGYGFMCAKEPWVVATDSYCIGEPDNKPQYKEVTKINGPLPTVIPFQDFGVSPNAEKVSTARFKYHILRLKRWDLLERKFLNLYDSSKIDAILAFPDRSGPEQVEREKDRDIGISTPQSKIEEEWDIYECHYPYWVNVGGEYRKLSIIETYHYQSKTSLRAYHNWYPDNECIFTSAHLGYTDRGLYSLGYCEMLEHAQVETSAQHNRYADNGTLANTGAFRVDPDALTKMDTSFSVFPTSVLPFKDGEFEAIVLGRETDNGVERERQNLEMVKARTGIDTGMTAAGGGIINPKRGIYSAQGTFSALQAGNRRGNLRTADMKYAHIEMGRKFLKFYSEFGIGDRKRYFGKDAKYLELALQNIKTGRLRIPVRAATASINKEMEKQNIVLLNQQFRQHYAMIGQLIQQIQQLAQGQPEAAKYAIDVVIASDFLMRKMSIDFGYEDVSRLVPEPAFITKLKEQQANAERQRNNGRPNGGGGTSEGSNIPKQPLLQDNFPTQGQDTGSVQQSAEHILV